jgi:hypothetical protein
MLLSLIGVLGPSGTVTAASRSSAQSSFCASVSTVKSDVKNLRALKSNPSISVVKTDLQKLYKDINTAIAQAKSAASSQVKALKASVRALKTTFAQVKTRKTTLRSAVPTIKSQAKTVQKDVQSVASALKC